MLQTILGLAKSNPALALSFLQIGLDHFKTNPASFPEFLTQVEAYFNPITAPNTGVVLPTALKAAIE